MSLCSQCNKELSTKSVKCYGCNSLYHFSPCCSLSEKTYSTMAMDRRADWRCHRCKTRKASTNSNNGYLTIIDNSIQPATKQQRDDDEVYENDDTKRFKDSLSLSDVNKSITLVKNDVLALKDDVTAMKTNTIDIKAIMEKLAVSVNQSNQINENIQTAVNAITNTLTTLTSQVNDLTSQVSALGESNKEKEKEMQMMKTQINDLQQQLINKSIEIKNFPNENILPNDAVKTIATSLNVELNDFDINNSYHIKKSKKIIIEFTTLNKKKELMGKIKRHRIESKVITRDENDKKKNYDEFTIAMFLYLPCLQVYNRKRQQNSEIIIVFSVQELVSFSQKIFS